jgi:hypothetical protein
MRTVTTTSSFAEEPLKIPSAMNENAGEDKNLGLERVIERSERKILREVLGDAQYATLLTELGKKPFTVTSPETASGVYIDLVEGDESIFWHGLRPMLENFIFCEWLRVVEVRLNHVGSGKGKSQGFSVADNSSKFADTWNDFVEMLSNLEKYLEESDTLELPDTFPEYETVNSLGL